MVPVGFSGKSETVSTGFKIHKCYWLVVSTHLKNISQSGSSPQVGIKIKKMKPPPRFDFGWLENSKSTLRKTQDSLYKPWKKLNRGLVWIWRWIDFCQDFLRGPVFFFGECGWQIYSSIKDHKAVDTYIQVWKKWGKPTWRNLLVKKVWACLKTQVLEMDNSVEKWILGTPPRPLQTVPYLWINLSFFQMIYEFYWIYPPAIKYSNGESTIAMERVHCYVSLCTRGYMQISDFDFIIPCDLLSCSWGSRTRHGHCTTCQCWSKRPQERLLRDVSPEFVRRMWCSRVFPQKKPVALEI